MNSGHESLNDSELVVKDLGKRSQAVGGAGGVRDDVLLGVVLVEVDTCDTKEVRVSESIDADTTSS